MWFVQLEALLTNTNASSHPRIHLPTHTNHAQELVTATYASTGGPNTMVCSEYTPAVQEATLLATCIENSGQCTAMRHLVAPNVSLDQVEHTFDTSSTIQGADDALREGKFAALYKV